MNSPDMEGMQLQFLTKAAFRLAGSSHLPIFSCTVAVLNKPRLLQRRPLSELPDETAVKGGKGVILQNYQHADLS